MVGIVIRFFREANRPNPWIFFLKIENKTYMISYVRVFEFCFQVCQFLKTQLEKNLIKVHMFWEGHKNMTKSPNFFWQNGLLSKFFSKFFDFLKKWAAADKPCPQLQPTLLRRPFCQKKIGDFVIFLWPSQNIWTLTIGSRYVIIFADLWPLKESTIFGLK